MADSKVTALTALTGATVDPNADVVEIVDVSDTTMDASGTSKKIKTGELLAVVSGDATVTPTTGALTIAAGAITAAKNHQKPYCFLQAGTKFALPNNVWIPIPLASALSIDTDTDSMWPGIADTATIASGSNSVALPTATINVNSVPSDWPTAGYVVITGPPAASTDTIVHYTGKTSTTLTGCSLGTGTLATGQTVRAANADLTINTTGLYQALACATFPAAGNTTGLFGVRLLQTFAIGSQQIGNPNAGLTLSAPAQPLFTSTGTVKIRAEVFQSSGATITLAIDGIQAPSIAMAWVSPP